MNTTRTNEEDSKASEEEWKINKPTKTEQTAEENSTKQSIIVNDKMPRRQGPPRKWLMDRISGQSKYNDRDRPPGPCCWVPPCVGWSPSFFETNACCRIFGGIGVGDNESFRFWCLHLGFVANIGAMLLTAYACLSISLQYFLLSKASLEILQITQTTGDTVDTITIFTGLQGVAIDDPTRATSSTGQQIMVGYDDFCEFSNDGLVRYLDPTMDCNSCSSNYFSMNSVFSILMSVATFFPTFFSQQLRLYSGYDVNCVKNSFTLLGIITILLNLNVMLTYFFLCSKESFYEDGTVFFDAVNNAYDAPPVDSIENYWKVQYQRKWGLGLILLVAGTGLKLIDVLCNLAIATPNVTRDPKEQDIYETIVFASPSSDIPTDDDENNVDDPDPF
mmetsp:Transcript_27803/g.65332  ORF Transcript_27803/g.65332 Transcript_27803/m.65332 type:complete len:390 (+) Transcript_27803:61-1230(+)